MMWARAADRGGGGPWGFRRQVEVERRSQPSGEKPEATPIIPAGLAEARSAKAGGFRLQAERLGTGTPYLCVA